MAIPPQGDDPEDSRPWFRRLRELRDELAARPEWARLPGGWLSMGMSDDFEVAIEEGATHVRVGTALFGPRTGLCAGPVEAMLGQRISFFMLGWLFISEVDSQEVVRRHQDGHHSARDPEDALLAEDAGV